jgi:transposase
MIRIDAIWLATAPLDMRAGMDVALARVVAVFGAAHPHTAYLFANARANRIKVLVHDGLGIWLAARRLHQGKFIWTARDAALGQPNGQANGLPHYQPNHQLQRAQFDALVLGLPWARIGAASVITMV